MSKTIKQLADELGVSKTAIRKRLTPEFRAEYVETTANGVLTITANGCAKIAETLQTSANSVSETGETQVSSLESEMIAFLKSQLEEKDRQLKEKDMQIESLNKALLQAQELTDQAHKLQAKNVMALEAPKKRWSWFRSKGE